MFPTLVWGLLMLGVAVKYAVIPDKRLVPLLLGLGVLTLASGMLGFVTGLIVTCCAIGGVAPERQTPIAITGFGESLNNVAFALVFLVLAAMAGSYGAYRLSRSAGERGLAT
jgi:uncharacterized membrane protein